MPSLTTSRGEALGYRVAGSGAPLIVVPGGPARDADYLEDLGGLSHHRRTVITLDPPGTGDSPLPVDPVRATAAAIAEDVEELRRHLGLDRIDLAAHSAGAAVALLYAAAHPERVSRLVLITPSTRIVELEDSDEEWEAQRERRRGEPWFDRASAALDEVEVQGWTPDLRAAMTPFFYGAWDERAQAHASRDADQRNLTAAQRFWHFESDAAAVREGLGRVTAPVRVIRGELDLVPGAVVTGELAGLFRDAGVESQAGAGHFPWVDDPDAFVALMLRALAG